VSERAGDAAAGGPVVHSPDPSLATPERRAVERFLLRVAALDAVAWGRLDAAGQRLNAGDPVARWERSRRVVAVTAAAPFAEAVLAPLDFAASAVRDLARWLRDAPPEPWGMRPPPDLPLHDADARWFMRSLQTLWDTAIARPAGPGPAIGPLVLALLALGARGGLPAEAFTRMYELVEPEIPAASLG
jgi:hypothetical protein